MPQTSSRNILSTQYNQKYKIMPQYLQAVQLNQCLHNNSRFQSQECINLYNSFRYNYFTKLTMAQRQLTYQEANKLCEQVLILICKRNQELKQKTLKNNFSPFLNSSEISLNSPAKALSNQTKYQPQEFATIQHQCDFSESPFKKLLASPHKLSIERESTFLGHSDLSQQAQFKLSQRQDGNPDLALRTAIMSSQQELKISRQLTKEISQKFCQVPELKQQRLYTQSSIKDLKRDLQISSKGKICRAQNLNNQTGQIEGYYFLCKNDRCCPFKCYLEFTGKVTPKRQRIYRLHIQNEAHLKSCCQEDEEITFMKLTKTIDSMEGSIQKLLSQNAQIKPKDILTKIAEQLGEADHKFIYNGLTSKNYHKAAKKYFDNLIYKARNPSSAQQ